MKRFNRNIFSVVIASSIIGFCIIIAAGVVSLYIGRSSIARTDAMNMFGNILMDLQDLKKSVQSIETRISKAGIGEPPPAPPKPGTKKVEGLTQGSNPVKGDVNAPVLLVQFGDFQCPFSKKFCLGTLPQLEKDYISTGKVKFAYRDFPLPFHPLAEPAAIAARCAAKQDKYWEMFQRLSGKSELTPETIPLAAKELRLNIKSFNACLQDPAIKAQVAGDSEEGAKFGVSGTPACFINGRMIEGAYPFETFKEIIEEELKK